MNSRKLLMVFVRNPELGKVKTRLARTVGDKKALLIYENLLKYTCGIVSRLFCDKAVFYSDFIDDEDIWSNYEFQKYLQEGNDLGERMMNAFSLAFSRGYSKVVIIGSDCRELTSGIMEKAFDLLAGSDVVLGPASDGGYYLLGMKKPVIQLFKDKPWSTENLFLDTLLDIQQLGLSYEIMETLSDVDREEDLGELQKLADEED